MQEELAQQERADESRGAGQEDCAGIAVAVAVITRLCHRNVDCWYPGRLQLQYRFGLQLRFRIT